MPHEKPPEKPTDLAKYREDRIPQIAYREFIKLLDSRNINLDDYPKEARMRLIRIGVGFYSPKVKGTKIDELSKEEIDLFFINIINPIIGARYGADFERQNFFRANIRDMEEQWSNFRSFITKVRFIRDYKDDPDHEKIAKMSDEKLIEEIRDSTREDWTTSPNYYNLIYKKILEGLGK